ncbi:cytosine permease [Burkholderia cenocepacia]|uniref:Cytosine permease n=4 Tax=Pseudomonadota TaxID=1224 RepID=A0A6B2MJ28_9BURK|nr:MULTISPECIES: cytosine permease [Burkholderia]AIO43402.1 permease for cytosine/purine, uracil, thiamine, allantoin family protein [Burkholderia cepacia]AQQ40339.1 cytosine permease [Burkholderia cenocepacia]KGC05039.1 permease for cytosine/purine, uracil, thiamine, allantoin family protein [Burkholderia cepacia]KWF24797.1 allantoin permease [Burkholderia cenocepacia]MBG0880033.1 cytosine permease [Burkholderia sp. 9775_39]
MTNAERNASPMIEKHTIGYVPPAERHGKVRDLFTLWFGGNIAPLPIVTGALGVQMFHLNLMWGIVAIVVGQAVGGVLMALHSAQGPQMGIPQMIQSRAQFGSWGALLVTVIAAVMYVGFFASNIVLAGKSVHGIASSVPVPVGIVIGAVGSGLIGIVGYRFIHILNRIGTWVLGIGIAVGFWMILSHVSTADFLTRGGFDFAGWLATVSLSALWQIAFAPYVSDYSRYLPENVGVASTFWATYLGCTLGSTLAFIFGAVAVLAVPAGADTMDAVKQATGPLGPLMLVLFLLSVISHNALNLYGAVLAVITSVQTFAYKWIPTAKARAVVSVVIFVACCYAAIGASTNFVGNLVDLVLALLVVLVPWTAINLIDFYVIHKGKYDIQSIFMADGGIYGRFNPQALLAYAIGIVVQIPFMNTPMYAGPIPAHLGGADLSWLVGLLLTSPLYYWLATRDSAYRRRQGGAHLPPTAVR